MNRKVSASTGAKKKKTVRASSCMTRTEAQMLYREIKALREEVRSIRQLLDSDSVMTSEEAVLFEKSMAELNRGKTVPLSVVKRELGL